MRRFLTILIFQLTLSFKIFSQDSEELFLREDWGKYSHMDLAIGLNRNPSPTSESTAYHSLELSVWKSTNLKYHHPASITFFFSQEVGLSSKRIIHGIKGGAWVGFWGFILGAEAKYLTDYKDNVVILSPFFGFGNYPLRISIGYEGILSGSGDLRNLNNLNVNISLAVFKLRNPKKID